MVVVDAWSFIFWPLICPQCCPCENSRSLQQQQLKGALAAHRSRGRFSRQPALCAGSPRVRGASTLCWHRAAPAEPRGTRTRGRRAGLWPAAGLGGWSCSWFLTPPHSALRASRSVHLFIISWNIWTNAAGHSSPSCAVLLTVREQEGGPCCDQLP